jgi:hypothetical protein
MTVAANSLTAPSKGVDLEASQTPGNRVAQRSRVGRCVLSDRAGESDALLSCGCAESRRTLGTRREAVRKNVISHF